MSHVVLVNPPSLVSKSGEGHMLPCFTPDSNAHSALTNPITSGKFSLRDAAPGVLGSGGCYPLIGKFSAATTLAMRVSPFCHHVPHVVLVRTEKQVVRAAAGRIVAFVQNIKALWNGAIVQFPGETVRQFNLITANVYAPVSTFLGVSKPYPATIGSLHLLPKPSGKFSPSLLSLIAVLANHTATLAPAHTRRIGLGLKLFAAVEAMTRLTGHTTRRAETCSATKALLGVDPVGAVGRAAVLADALQIGSGCATLRLHGEIHPFIVPRGGMLATSPSLFRAHYTTHPPARTTVLPLWRLRCA